MGKGKLRNKPCPCKSGKKYKNCCLWKDDTYLTKDQQKLLSKTMGYNAQMGKEQIGGEK